MNKKTSEILSSLIFPIAAVIIIALIWHAFYLSAGSEFIFPSIKSVAEKTVRYISDGYFWQSFLNTLARVFLAVIIAFVPAALIGTAGYYFPFVRKAVSPIVKIMISAPTVAVMLIINMLPISKNVSPVIVALTVIFPMVYSSIISASEQIDKKLIEMAKIYGVPLKKRIFSLILPSVLPFIIEQAGTVLAFTLKITVSAEIIAYTYKSLGGILQQANTYYDMAGVLAVTVISVITAVIFEFAIKAAVRLYKRKSGYDKT